MKKNNNDPGTEKNGNVSGLLFGIGKKLLVLVVIGLAIQFTLPQITSFQTIFGIGWGKRCNRYIHARTGKKEYVNRISTNIDPEFQNNEIWQRNNK